MLPLGTCAPAPPLLRRWVQKTSQRKKMSKEDLKIHKCQGAEERLRQEEREDSIRQEEREGRRRNQIELRAREVRNDLNNIRENIIPFPDSNL